MARRVSAESSVNVVEWGGVGCGVADVEGFQSFGRF